MKIPISIGEVLAAAERTLRALFTFFGGFMAGKSLEKNKSDKAIKKIEEKQNESDQDFERLRRNKPRRKRLLDLIRKARGSD